MSRQSYIVFLIDFEAILKEPIWSFFMHFLYSLQIIVLELWVDFLFQIIESTFDSINCVGLILQVFSYSLPILSNLQTNIFYFLYDVLPYFFNPVELGPINFINELANWFDLIENIILITNEISHKVSESIQFLSAHIFCLIEIGEF